jgi:hypothetical protein
MSFIEGLTATKTGIGLIKSAVDLVRREEIDRNEVLARLTELQGLVLDARTALSDGQEEVNTLRRALDDRDALNALHADMEYQQDGGSYFCVLHKVTYKTLARLQADRDAMERYANSRPRRIHMSEL